MSIKTNGKPTRRGRPAQPKQPIHTFGVRLPLDVWENWKSRRKKGGLTARLVALLAADAATEGGKGGEEQLEQTGEPMHDFSLRVPVPTWNAWLKKCDALHVKSLGARLVALIERDRR